MFDRYENEDYELELKLRAGAQFIAVAQTLYDQLNASVRQ